MATASPRRGSVQVRSIAIKDTLPGHETYARIKTYDTRGLCCCNAADVASPQSMHAQMYSPDIGIVCGMHVAWGIIWFEFEPCMLHKEVNHDRPYLAWFKTVWSLSS